MRDQARDALNSVIRGLESAIRSQETNLMFERCKVYPSADTINAVESSIQLLKTQLDSARFDQMTFRRFQ